MDNTNEAAPENASGSGIYLLAAHPDWRASRVNRRIFAAAQSTGGVQTQDLYASYPDYSINVAAEQKRLADASLIVLVHPVQWYSMPALQKLWVDEVLTYGWAYGPGGTALRGKDIWLVVTTGGQEDAYHPSGYNRYFFDAFLPPYEQTAVLCGMRFLPPLVLHGAHSASEEEVTDHIETFRQRLSTYPQWPEIADMDECIACEVPATDRPEIEAAQVAD